MQARFPQKLDSICRERHQAAPQAEAEAEEELVQHQIMAHDSHVSLRLLPATVITPSPAHPAHPPPHPPLLCTLAWVILH